MIREFYCSGCGLFFWEKPINYKHSWRCPSCYSESNSMVLAVDTYAFLNFSRSRLFDPEKSWSSMEFAPDLAIDSYKRRGIKLREKMPLI